MKECILILIVLMLVSCQSQSTETSQSVLHIDLSETFNYQSFIERIPTEYFDSCLVKVKVSHKKDKTLLYEANITSTYLLGDNTFENNNVRSFITGTNIEKEVVDNDFGDIVVADFNFDNLEDFAVKREEGGNSGPIYNFYIQLENKSFELDEYLSNTMIWFPNKINSEQKMLQTLVRASSVSTCETTYLYNSTKKTWREVQKQYYGE